MSITYRANNPLQLWNSTLWIFKAEQETLLIIKGPIRDFLCPWKQTEHHTCAGCTWSIHGLFFWTKKLTFKMFVIVFLVFICGPTPKHQLLTCISCMCMCCISVLFIIDIFHLFENMLHVFVLCCCCYAALCSSFCLSLVIIFICLWLFCVFLRTPCNILHLFWCCLLSYFGSGLFAGGDQSSPGLCPVGQIINLSMTCRKMSCIMCLYTFCATRGLKSHLEKQQIRAACTTDTEIYFLKCLIVHDIK